MGDNLAEHVARLRSELNGIKLVYVEKSTDEMTHVMVQMESLSDEIDALEAYVIRESDQKCLYVLRKKMSEYFDREDTKTLIHDMGISEFDYTGDTMSGMHAELISHCKRHGIISDLIRFSKSKRPRVRWPDCESNCNA